MIIMLLCTTNGQRSQTVLHLAAELAKIEVVDMLLKNGLDFTIKDKVNRKRCFF